MGPEYSTKQRIREERALLKNGILRKLGVHGPSRETATSHPPPPAGASTSNSLCSLALRYQGNRSTPQARPLTRQPNTLIEEIKTPNKDGSSFFLCTDIHPDSVHTHTDLSLGQHLARPFNDAQSTKTQQSSPTTHEPSSSAPPDMLPLCISSVCKELSWSAARKMPPRPRRTTRDPPPTLSIRGCFPSGGLRLFSASVRDHELFFRDNDYSFKSDNKEVSTGWGSLCSLMFGPTLRTSQGFRVFSNLHRLA